MKIFLVALLSLPALIVAAQAQEQSADALAPKEYSDSILNYLPNGAPKSESRSREEQEKLYLQGNQGADRAIRSMCIECLGKHYNRQGSKTPLMLPDELSLMTTSPEIEREP